MDIFAKGLTIGFLIALPVGPVAIVCIHRTLAGSKRHGLISGLGAATADALYGGLAALGLSVTATYFQQHASAFQAVGGIALGLLGIKTFFSIRKKDRRPATHVIHAGNFLSTFFLTLMNPMTLIAFAIVFASSGLQASQDMSAALLVSGVFCGSALWWLTLSILAGAFSNTVNEEHMGLINRTAGALILLLGVWVFFRGHSMTEQVVGAPNPATALSDIVANETDPNGSRDASLKGEQNSPSPNP